MNRPIHGILFDLDNTLADREEAFLRWARWFAATHLEIADDGALAEAIAALALFDGNGATPKDEFFRAVKTRYPTMIGALENHVTTFRHSLIAHLPPLDAGASQLLAALDAANVPWGIVTNGTSRSQRGKVVKLGLEPRAACIVVSEEVGWRKPETEVFRIAAQLLGIDTGEVLFVGDHPVADIVGAANAGMRTAWLDRGRVWPTSEHGVSPDFIVASLSELGWVADRSANGAER